MSSIRDRLAAALLVAAMGTLGPPFAQASPPTAPTSGYATDAPSLTTEPSSQEPEGYTADSAKHEAARLFVGSRPQAADSPRDALAAQLRNLGVAVDDAAGRVAAMRDDEVIQALDQPVRAPAGGDAVGVLFSVFIVLLITDILGLTKVFPFTRSINR